MHNKFTRVNYNPVIPYKNREGEKVGMSNLSVVEGRSNAENLQHCPICVFALKNWLVMARVYNTLSPVEYEPLKDLGS